MVLAEVKKEMFLLASYSLSNCNLLRPEFFLEILIFTDLLRIEKNLELI